MLSRLIDKSLKILYPTADETSISFIKGVLLTISLLAGTMLISELYR